jgi:vacuolar-type H+-ATPase subunit H
MSVEEIRNLVKQEKEMEENLKMAEEQAATIIENAREKARQMLQDAEDPRTYDKIFNERLAEVEGKKKLVEKEVNKKAEQVREAANKNLEKTVSFILKHVLGE